MASTALWMSRHRIHIPIYALTPRLSTQRKMALYRNVRPLLMDTSADRDTALDQAKGHLLMRGIVQSGDVYAITCGEPMGRMHSDAQFAGSSSVPAHVEMMGFLGMGNNPMVGATVTAAVAVEEAMK